MAWCEAMDQSLRLESADCHSMIKHLFHAAISVPFRYRLTPSAIQIQLDSSNCSEVLRQAGMACVDSCWEFATKVQSLQPLARMVGNPRMCKS